MPNFFLAVSGLFELNIDRANDHVVNLTLSVWYRFVFFFSSVLFILKQIGQTAEMMVHRTIRNCLRNNNF